MKRAIAILLILVALLAIPAEAKAPRNGKYYDAQGHIFIMRHGKPRTGHFKYKGKWYYGHKTSTKKYPKGSCTAGDMRVERGNKWYAYHYDGTMFRYDRYVRKGRDVILQLDIRSRDHTVRYIYGTSMRTRGHRYSTKLCRMQYLDERDVWRTYEGMPYYPDFVDQQR